jgi:hypothetical protein
MKVEIVLDENNRACGWEMSGENEEEIKKLGIIRDLQFWGTGDNVITYNGRRQSDDKNNNPGILSWVQKRIQNKRKEL